MFQEKFQMPYYGSGFEIDDVYRSKLSVREIDGSPDVECALCQDTITEAESYGTEVVVGSARKLLFAFPEEIQRVCGGCAFAHGDGRHEDVDESDESDDSDGLLEAA